MDENDNSVNVSNVRLDVGKLSKPIEVFINKVASAIGIYYEPKRIKNLAKAKIEAEKIEL